MARLRTLELYLHYRNSVPQRPEGALTPKVPKDAASTGLRILVVEDESVIALVLEDLLVQFGHKVIGPVGRVNKAVEMAQHEALDVAILDVNLNGQEVYPVAAALSARGIPFVFTTGHSRDKLPPPYRNRPVLNKPFQWRDLRDVLAKIGR